MERLIKLLQELMDKQALIKMVFGGVRRKDLPYQKAAVRPVLLQDELRYQIEYHSEKKVIHENIDGAELLYIMENLMSECFKQLNIFSVEADYQILAAKPDKPRILKKPPTKELESLSHNQEKQYIIPEGRPCDFLVHLGVMNQTGQVLQKHYNKFRQINRFLEIVSDVITYLPKKKTVRIVDFGCGKAYLTFALYHYLKKTLNRDVEIIGLDLKEDVIEFCSNTARSLHYEGLKFLVGDIADYEDTSKADMVVTLHACDTATDLALIKAVGWDASIILSVPCCQHELFDQIKNEINHPVLKHGILKERFSAILTDSLRALKLEERGYDVSMIEFTSLEHTAKNIMIRAVRNSRAMEDVPSAAKADAAEKARQEYDALKEFWQVSPAIDLL